MLARTLPARLKFNPLRLNPVLWLRADYGTLQTSGGTAAVADADPVGQWLDLSGNGNHVVQATSTKRPTLKLAIQNGRPGVRFDGVDDLLKVTLAATLNQPFVGLAVVTPRTVPARFVGSFGPNEADLVSTDASSQWEIYAGTLLYPAGFPLAVVGTPVVTAGCLNGSSSFVAINRATKTVGNAGADTGCTTLTLGASLTPGNWTNVDLHELLVFPGAPTDAQWMQGRDYLNRGWEVY